MAKHRYRVGSKIQYRSWDGSLRTLVVEAKEDDIKNGRPGFDGGEWWGYDDQIVAVLEY